MHDGGPTGVDACTAYDDRIRALAAQRGVSLVELPDDLPADAFTSDRVHLTAAGRAQIADRIFAALETAGLWVDLR